MPEPAARDAASREAMVENQIVRRGIKDTYVLEAMRTVPREVFMPEDLSSLAYEDMPAPIGEGQTISQPYVVAMMASLADLHPTDKVLEIGTGSGYGAAVLSRIAHHVYTIERHEVLARHAQKVIDKLGYDNITILVGDGTKGLAVEAPFDAIVVTAGAPGIPEVLQEQLAVGGRLIIPAGSGSYQHLLQIRRTSETSFETNEFGAVRFVPLVGEYGWRENGQSHRARPLQSQADQHPVSFKERQRGKKRPHRPVFLLQQEARKIPGPASPHFAEQFDYLGQADVVLLGESTHGTAEFYRARAVITQHLVRNHDFNIVALEADWPDVAVMDGYVRDRHVPPIGQPAFARFPEWMWRNEEFRMLIHWLRKHNDRPEAHGNKAGLYGLDLYSLQASIYAVTSFLEKTNPPLADIARDRYGCFKPWLEDPAAYGQTVITADFIGCEKQAVEMLVKLLDERAAYAEGYEESYLDAVRNATVVTQAEKYYRIMYRGSAESWNLRDTHMFDTLQAVMKSKGDKAKAIVWAHNSHIGDARATEMGKVRGELNLGQLCREYYGDRARLVGFGTGEGEVAAASHWGGPMEVKRLRAPLAGSAEKLWQQTGLEHAALNMREISDDLREELEKTSLGRAVGVIYRPRSERTSHYFETQLARQFDDYIWFSRTNPVTAFPHIPEREGAETYPFGL